MSNFNQ